MQYNQTLNPLAGNNLEPVEGMDGVSAVNTFENYRKGFTKEETRSGYDISLTGIGMPNK
jgi:hypothetical protein